MSDPNATPMPQGDPNVASQPNPPVPAAPTPAQPAAPALVSAQPAPPAATTPAAPSQPQLLPGQVNVPAEPVAPDMSKVGQIDWGHGKGGVLGAALIGALQGIKSGLSAPTSGSGVGGAFSAGARQAQNDADKRTELAKQNALANNELQRQHIDDLTKHNVYIATQYDQLKRLESLKQHDAEDAVRTSDEHKTSALQAQKLTNEIDANNQQLIQAVYSIDPSLLTTIHAGTPNANQAITANVPSMVNGQSYPVAHTDPETGNPSVSTFPTNIMSTPLSKDETLHEFTGSFDAKGNPVTVDRVFQSGQATLGQLANSVRENTNSLAKARTTYLEQQSKQADTKRSLAAATEADNSTNNALVASIGGQPTPVLDANGKPTGQFNWNGNKQNGGKPYASEQDARQAYGKAYLVAQATQHKEEKNPPNPIVNLGKIRADDKATLKTAQVEAHKAYLNRPVSDLFAGTEADWIAKNRPEVAKDAATAATSEANYRNAINGNVKPPTGAVGKVPDKQGRMHWYSATHQDLGLVQ